MPYMLVHRPISTTAFCFAKLRMVSQKSCVHESMASSDSSTLDSE